VSLPARRPGTDILTRMLAAELQDKLKQTVGWQTASAAAPCSPAQTVERSAPDGHTLLLAPVTTLRDQSGGVQVAALRSVKDFAPIGLVGAAGIRAGRQSLPRCKTLPRLIDIIKKRRVR